MPKYSFLLHKEYLMAISFFGSILGQSVSCSIQEDEVRVNFLHKEMPPDSISATLIFHNKDDSCSAHISEELETLRDNSYYALLGYCLAYGIA